MPLLFGRKWILWTLITKQNGLVIYFRENRLVEKQYQLGIGKPDELGSLLFDAE